MQQQTLVHRGYCDNPLYGIHRMLRRGDEPLSPAAWARLLAALDAGDTAGEQVGRAWIGAQDLRLIYRSRDHAQARTPAARLA